MRKLFGLILIPLLAANLLARQLSPDDKIELFDDFSDGLNTQSDSTKLTKKSSPNLQNVFIDEKVASLVERRGWIVSGSTPTLTKIVTAFPFVKDNGDRELMISDSSRTLSTRDFMTYAVVKNTQTTTAVLRCSQGRGKAWCTNGADPVFTWDGTTAIPLDGNNGAPNVPRGKYIVFYIDRFWVGATTTSNSAVNFSALSSTDGFAIAPDDPRAWLLSNQLNISLGDGYAVSGFDVFKGQLQVHKYNSSIHTIFGTDEFSFFARKTNASAGTVSQDSIAQLDNLEYYLAKDGVYAFDGSDSVRISDAIQPDIMAVVTNLSNVVTNRWDTQTQFVAGGLSTIQGATITPGGFVQPLNSYIVNIMTETIVRLGAPAPAFFFAPAESFGSTTTNFVPIAGPSYNSGNKFSGWISSIAVQTTGTNGNLSNSQIVMTLKNLTTGLSVSTNATVLTFLGAPDSSAFKRFVFPIPLYFNTADIALQNLVFKVDVDTRSWALNESLTMSSVSVGGGGDINIANTTGSYVSEITTISASNNFWDQFNSANSPNGGTVNFFIKGGTAPIGAISTEAFTSIVPGTIVSLPFAKRFIVWASTLAGSDVTNVPNIDNVEINHNEGSANDARPFAWTWLNRYWLAVTTTTAGNNTIIYVKSKGTNSNPNAWTKFTGINIRSFTRFGDNFQAGSSSAGAVLRLDYGTNDNGQPIAFSYETPDANIDGRTYFDKVVFEYLVNAVKNTGATLSVGTSIDGGSFVTDTISLDGSGILNSSLVPSSSFTHKGKTFRFRFSNTELDKSITLNSFGVIYQGTDAR